MVLHLIWIALAAGIQLEYIPPNRIDIVSDEYPSIEWIRYDWNGTSVTNVVNSTIGTRTFVVPNGRRWDVIHLHLFVYNANDELIDQLTTSVTRTEEKSSVSEPVIVQGPMWWHYTVFGCLVVMVFLVLAFIKVPVHPRTNDGKYRTKRDLDRELANDFYN